MARIWMVTLNLFYSHINGIKITHLKFPQLRYNCPSSQVLIYSYLLTAPLVGNWECSPLDMFLHFLSKIFGFQVYR